MTISRSVYLRNHVGSILIIIKRLSQQGSLLIIIESLNNIFSELALIVHDTW
ncbi:hypothetical protein M2459_001943 [Parabacteroides sp. PF5-5]|nr:hypothetical protein [Parabacteroides sp. PH5-39]MDH6316200.1 hypothetical protein [Parabacteroides sp. PF5-13]MDH6321439.1 hypothetical protein [Parabacteroides sp. PH5-13]MDH6325170.1 hypothetical protein [Parabacteroides sp. PH5-8]MDH6327391.1 hypothetical protein [Parabacteroides sp. PH5-41]MDH6335193.1 hypothetical protein [Parabacteroides sp. PF5-5]MDH6346186.1 hypothetical protein [Parabacteroides sp. PH5-46]MDH6356016.1 hypothetical protein [Dysgonomonas sp. PH5-45]MDH6361213.1 h